MALARKYRPKNFASLVGQEAIAKTLALALDSNQLTHAYLFSGIRGSGKTSTARIFAKALLCQKGPTSNPCEECEHCQMANEGRHIDIIEMDAASNRGIDDIKELIEHTKYKPSLGKFKIFIIDEVHMLTMQAFNALLKTLEEPPPYVKFILATTDPLKLPATILSRVQHFRFKKIPLKTVVNHLAFILNKEGIEFEEAALQIIARSGGGSLRDSLTLLDQAIVYGNNKVDVRSVTQMLGIVDPAKLEELLDMIMKKDTNAILDFIENFSDYESEMILDEMLNFLQEKLLSQDKSLSTIIIDRFFRILVEGKQLLNLGANGDFVLSLTLFKMVEATNIIDIDEAIAKLQKELSQTPLSNHQSTSPTKETTPLKTKVENKSINQESLQEKEQKVNGQALFAKLIQKIYERNYELGKIFEENVKFVDYDGKVLRWESHANEQERASLRKAWSIIKLFVEEIFGVGVTILPTQKKNDDIKEKLSQEIEKNQEEPQKSSCIMPESNSLASSDKNPKDLLNEPMVQEIIKQFSPKRVVIKQKT